MPAFGSLGLKGLTANDRSQSDKIAIAQQGGSNLMVTPPNFDMSANRKYFQGISDTNAIMQNTYQDMLQRYKDQFHVDRDKNRVGNSPMNIKEIAAKVSPWFKKYGYSDYIDLSDMDWAELAASYQAATEAYNDNGATANAMLDNAIKNNVAKNQPWYEQAWYGFTGMGASAAGAAIGFAGAVKGAIDYFDGAYEDKEGLNGWQNFMNSVIDNDWSRYGNDVVQYGSLRPSAIDEAKELGISNLQIVETDDQENSLISTASPWVAMQSGGFTLASMFLGAGEAKVASLLFKGLGTAAKAVKTGEALTATLANLQKAENFTNKFIIPGMVGTMEGLSEGLNTKQQAEQDGLQAVQEMQQQEVGAEVNKRLQNYDQVMIKGSDGGSQVVKYKDKKTGQLLDINQIYQQVWDEYAPKYEESLKQVEYASAKAGINNFYVNSLINGMINSTLKAGLQAPSVRNALSKTKLFGWAQPRSNFDITGSGSTTTVTPKFGIGKKAWNIIKEPLGEFGEEYMQSVSDATMRGGAENNIHEFIDNKYKGDGSAAVGDNFSSDWNASWTALTGSVTDHETIKSGIYGAISSVMGTPSLGHRARTGRIDANGNAETTYFGRGLNERGERESQLERLGRILPWRSGITQAYRENQIEQHRAEEAAQVLQDWLRDPNNKDKFDGLVGTFNWAKAMGDAGLGSDEFGYRNSALGKTISDAFMLQKLQGTKYYDAYLKQLAEIANLEEGSELAEKYISAMRDNINTSEENQSDADILKTLKSNANKMLSTLDSIEQESDRVDKLVGNVDEDTKQSLIYGQMMLKDWHEREQKLKEELSNIHVENSVEHSSSLTDKQKQILADYNSIEEAKKQQAELEKKLTAVREDIKNLKSRSNLTDTEKGILKSKKTTVKSIEKELKRLEAINDVEEGASEVLSEQEIMNLDPISRAIMLRRGKQKTYVATHGGREELTRRIDELNSRIDNLNNQRTKYIKDNGRVKKGHNKQVQKIDADIAKAQKELDAVRAEEKPYYSAEQQAVIDNLFNQGTAQDENFLDKMVDAGRIRNSIESFNEQYQAILSDPHSFNNYVFNARQSAADIASKRKFQAMNNIQNYADFAREMDRMYRESSGREQLLITNAFRDKNNANFERYTKERQMLQDLIEQVTDSEQHKNMSVNDKEMFAHTITYLSNRGIDFNDNQAVVEALAATDENGISEFKKYVEEANASLPEAEQTAFTSIGEAIQNFNDVMINYNKDVAQREANAAPIEVTPTSEESATPAVNPEPVHQEGANQSSGKSIFDIAGSSTPEGGFIDSSGQVIDTSDSSSNKDTGSEGTENQSSNSSSSTNNTSNQVTENFKTNSNDEVAKAAEIALNVVKNQPNIDEETRKNVQSFIEGLSSNSFNTVQEFTDALNSSANTRETNSEDGIDNAANLLRQIAAKVQANEASKKTVEDKKPMSLLLDKKGQELNRTNQILNGNYNMFPNANTGSSFIASINIDYVRQRFPNSSTVKYYDKYKIEDALRNGILDSKPDIFFITDEELTKSVSQEMGDSYNAARSLPIVAVVKSKDGPIKIGNESYQPISIMASTDKEGSAGSTHMAPIRNAALSNQGTDLVSINNKPIVTKPWGFPKAYPVDRNYRGRNSVIEIGIGDLTQDERTSLESQSKTQRRSNPTYQRAKSNFLSHLGTKMIGGRKALVFNQPTLNGKFNSIEVFVNSINESTARNSDLSFEDAAREGNVSNFNSRTSRTAKALEGFFSSFTQEDLIFEEKDDQIVPTPQTAEALRTMADNLQKKIDNFINIPVKDGWKYRITPMNETDGDTRIMDLSIVNTNTNEVIPLATFNQGMNKESMKEASEDFLKNLILDNNGAVRMVGQDSFAKWNVLYSDVEKRSENRSAANNISDIYEDGILGAAATTFNYRIQGIAVQNPFNKEGNPVFTETANADNAAPSQPTTAPVIAEGQVRSGNAVVTDDGVVLDGKPNEPKNQALERAEAIVTQIENDSKGIKLADDGSAYVDSNGKRYARVTSVISADEKSDGRFGYSKKAPNGKPSNLPDHLWEYVRTKEFKDWFGDWEKVAYSSKFRESQDIPNSITSATYQGVYVSEALFDPDMAPDGGKRIILVDNKYIGEIPIIESKDKIRMSGSIGAATEIEEEYRGKGYGKKAHLALANIAKAEGKVLYSDSSNSDAEDALWKSLVKDGIAEVVSEEPKVGHWNHTVYRIINDKLPQADDIDSGDRNISKAVDENGEPLIVYRGYNSKYGALSRGSADTGLFFSTDKRYASQFGDNVQAAFLNIRNVSEMPELITENVEEAFRTNTPADAIIGHDKITNEKLIKSRGTEYSVLRDSSVKFVNMESVWTKPSTNIGTGFDEFVRDLFAGKLDSMTEEQLAENYPNATKEALQKFKEQLVGLKNNFIANGLTIVPRDVTVTGSLDVLDSNGNIHTVDVAGTLDLLAYDANGNFYIFDMKTNRSGIGQHKQEKYSRQLSLYKKFIENKYGVQVKSLNLIPIGVEYPAPVGHRNGTADYSVSPEKANQLLIDGKQFTGANPTLQTTIAVPYTEPHIVWEKMTDEEKAMFGGVEDTVAAQSDSSAKPTEAVVSEPTEIPIDPTLGVAFGNEADSLADMFGMDSSDIGNFNMDFSQRTTPIPSELQWNSLIQEQRDSLEMKGFNESSWSSMEDEEMKHELDCL